MARLSARGLLAISVVTLAACSAPAQPRPAPAQSRPAPQSPASSAPAQSVATAKAEPASAPAPAPAPVRAAPTRPAAHLWPFTKVGGVEWVKVDDVAAHYKLKTAWTKPLVERTLADTKGVRFRFEANQRDCYLDGVRVFLGRPVLQHQGGLWVTRLDVIKTIAPLLRPEDQLQHLPATPPKIIVLDAGHGGNDPGKQNLRLKLNEKDMALDVVLRLRKLLELRGYKVLVTRSTDTRLADGQAADLQARAVFANTAKADLFLCVHFNAVEAKDAARVTGTETYVLTPQFQWSSSDNTGDPLAGVAVPGNKHDVANSILGFHLHRELLAGLKTSDRGYKRARWAVLKFLDCPAGYIEAAYLSNDAEAARVGTPEFRQRIAESIASGVQDYADALAALRPPPTPAK